MNRSVKGVRVFKGTMPGARVFMETIIRCKAFQVLVYSQNIISDVRVSHDTILNVLESPEWITR